MVTLEQMRSSNARIGESLPAGMVAVFVGGTSGIGEATMKLFAKHAVEPHIYFVGRSDRAAVRIINELTAINPGGQYHFIQADLSLLQNVDDVCHNIKSHEELINLLFLTSGTMVTGKGNYYPSLREPEGS
jgi:NADP-dependent 3-hydroxy acid dehydrogenase YdfG